MMKCEKAGPVMDAYLDGELELSSCLAMEEHLASCEGCRKQLEERGELVLRIREEATRFKASPFLATRVRASLRPEGVTERASFFVEWIREIASALEGTKRRYGVTTGLVALALGVCALAIFGREEADSRLGEEAIANHVRSLQASHLMDVVSTDRHTVKPWFAGKLDFSPVVVDLKDEGYPLIGGRLDLLDHRDVAALVYQRRKHFINLFIWPAQGSANDRVFQADGYRVHGWTAGGMNYLAVSELGAAEMREFAKGIKGGGWSVR